MPIKMPTMQIWVICPYSRVFLGLPQSILAAMTDAGCTWRVIGVLDRGDELAGLPMASL